MIQRNNDWSAMQQSLYHDMQVDSSGAFAARSPLDSLAVAAPGRTRCVNAENPTGGKGALRPLQPVHLVRRAKAAPASRP